VKQQTVYYKLCMNIEFSSSQNKHHRVHNRDHRMHNRDHKMHNRDHILKNHRMHLMNWMHAQNHKNLCDHIMHIRDHNRDHTISNLKCTTEKT
jgi:hypothetical protein